MTISTQQAIESLERFQNPEPWEPKITDRAYEALQMAISALEKQEVDKCCETCKHRNRKSWYSPCKRCYLASNLEDYYEPYTEEEA